MSYLHEGCKGIHVKIRWKGNVDSHRWFLQFDHPFRRNKNAFVKGDQMQMDYEEMQE
jgi:hypothetical protein